MKRAHSCESRQPLRCPDSIAKRVLDGFHYHRFHVVLCAIVAAWAWSQLLKDSLLGYKVFLVALLVSFVYALNKLGDRIEDEENEPGGPLAQRISSLIAFSSLAGLLGVVFLNTAVKKLDLIIIALCIGLGAIYTFPIRNTRLKNHWLLKNSSAAIGWTACTVILPASSSAQLFRSERLLLALVMFFAVIAVEILWDLRDVLGDQIAGVRTIATNSKTAALWAVSLTSLLLIAIICYCSKKYGLIWLLLTANVIVLGLSVLAHLRATVSRFGNHLIVEIQLMLLLILGLIARFAG
jgi:4-hydroxybenzoate polyprenyltransferase